MGGYQVYQWLISYPDFMDKAIVIEANPVITSSIKLFLDAEKQAIQLGLCNEGKKEQAITTAISILVMNLFTPVYMQNEVSMDKYDEFMGGWKASLSGWDIYDWKSQLLAIDKQNILARANIPLDKVSDYVKADVLIIINSKDQLTDSRVNKKFADAMNAKYIEYADDWGHLSIFNQGSLLSKEIQSFLTNR